MVQLYSHEGRSESVYKGDPSKFDDCSAGFFFIKKLCLDFYNQLIKEINYSIVMIVVKSFLWKEISIDLFCQFMEEINHSNEYRISSYSFRP